MKLSDLINLEAPTRWRKYWRAKFIGTSLESEGANKDQAAANLIEQIKRNDKNCNTRYYEVADNGAVFALYWAYDSWCYDIIRADNAHQPSSCHLSAPTVTEALERMRAHARQYGH